jgi:hypothetical protein
MSPMPKPGGKFINNILLSLSAGTRDVQGTNLGGMSARNNYFSEGRPGGDYEHAGNRFTGMRIAKTSGWRSVTARDQVNWRDFVLGSGSAAIRAGDDEPRRVADVQNDYDRDYNGLEYDAPMNMGALSYGTPLKPLSPRVNVSLPQPEPRGAQL